MEKKFVVLLSLVYLNSFVFGFPKSNRLKYKEEYEDFSHTPGVSSLVGGKRTTAGKYPFMVALYEKWGSNFEFVCGASVLNENWIITAAHCIDFVAEPYKYLAKLGLHRLSRVKASTVQVFKISKIVLHEDFDNKTFENDIALLKTAEAINIIGSKGSIDRIRLPSTDKDPSGNAKVLGWGHTYEDGENSDTLKEVVVPIIPRDLCNESYDDDLEDDVDAITETMICAGMAKRDSCQNDSGGPLFQTSTSGVSTLIGVVSHGAGCGEKYFPGVYTKVSSYKKWMEKIMSK